MREYLENFLRDFEYAEECRELLVSCYGAISADTHRSDILNEALTAYNNDRNVGYFVMEEYVKRICDGSEYHEYTVWLLVYILMTERLRELYLQNGISLDIWRDGINDLKTKAEECKDIKGIYGTFVSSWFPNLFRLRRFTFGRLQFELSHFSEDKFECSDGTVLKSKDRVIAVHIPRSSMPLSKQNCDGAYEAAADFFANEFQGEKVVFTCSSWMLYPKNSEILHERSNTRRFGEEYEIVTVTYHEAGEYPEAWRIFDVEFGGDIASLPENTFLQKAYKKYMLDGGITGRAYGVKLLQKKAE